MDALKPMPLHRLEVVLPVGFGRFRANLVPGFPVFVGVVTCIHRARHAISPRFTKQDNVTVHCYCKAFKWFYKLKSSPAERYFAPDGLPALRMNKAENVRFRTETPAAFLWPVVSAGGSVPGRYTERRATILSVRSNPSLSEGVRPT
ncbi:hypothetical protein F6X40_27725 [Paraburkholderia sp. UCT31]|uniref:hypothetical protein n=1 Tax=Paraburkholderia sp. UCT31 TaxID=2615209 RepID=UPI001655A7ED|nr:hypothetical protein [Paraburkholderia sp. UCT31]MBC8740429.1 hypothetical protein [Paraburkholderia sp. UCT31]